MVGTCKEYTLSFLPICESLRQRFNEEKVFYTSNAYMLTIDLAVYPFLQRFLFKNTFEMTKYVTGQHVYIDMKASMRYGLYRYESFNALWLMEIGL